MAEGTGPARGAEARLVSFGEIARRVVSAEGDGRFAWEGMTLNTLFQPLYSVQRGLAVGDEALVRGRTHDGQLLRANEMFEGRDRARLVSLDWVCRALHLRSYAVVDSGDRKLFLNVHPAALVDDPDGGRDFAELARFYGVSPERVHLEVLESASGGEDRLVEAVASHRKHGFAIVMDHFGQGRSNFDRLVALRPRLVKIDRAVLHAALGTTQERRMLPAFVEMLKSSGADVAATGVENAREALDCMEAGCGYLQGFHLGAPAPAPGDEALTGELLHSARRLAFG